MKRIALIVIAAFFSVVTLQAGEPISNKDVTPTQALEPEWTWTGFYVGGHLGGVWSNFDIGPFADIVDVDQQFDEFGDFFINPIATNGGKGPIFTGFNEADFPFGGGLNGASGTSASDDSFIGGGQLGYQHQFGHFVVGVEGDFSRLSPNRTDTFTGTDSQTHIVDVFFPGDIETNGPFPFPIDIAVVQSLESQTTYTASRRAELEWQGSARGKLGWASGKVLLYVTGGVAFGELKTTATGSATTIFTAHQDIFVDFFFPDGPFTNGFPMGGFPILSSSTPAGSGTTNNVSEKSETLMGWTGGGGGEYALNDKVSIGVEYRHTDLGSHTFSYDSHGGAVIPGSTKYNIENDQVTFRFNVLLSHFFGH